MTYAEISERLETLQLALENNILTVTMNRPSALNALNSQMLQELYDTLTMTEQEQEIYGLIITGAGRSFVAGADIVQMKPYKSEEGRAYAKKAQAIFSKLEYLPKPVIAAVNGYALGGGCELALSCDIRIASDKAVFGQPEVTLGIIPCFGGTQRLPRLIGPGISKEMIFTGRQVKAEEAYRIGLVNRVVPHDKLLPSAKDLLHTILQVSPNGIQYAKLAIQKGGDMDLNSGLELENNLAGLCFASTEKDIGMSAFIDKKKPIFH